MAGLNEELRFFHYLPGRFGRSWVSRFFVRTEKILCEVAAHKRIEEKLRIVEVGPELRDDVVRFSAVADESPVEQ